MTKRHFEAFAREIADYVRFSQDMPEATTKHATFAARVIAHVAAEFNPRFDRERFLKACGLSHL